QAVLHHFPWPIYRSPPLLLLGSIPSREHRSQATPDWRKFSPVHWLAKAPAGETQPVAVSARQPRLTTAQAQCRKRPGFHVHSCASAQRESSYRRPEELLRRSNSSSVLYLPGFDSRQVQTPARPTAAMGYLCVLQNVACAAQWATLVKCRSEEHTSELQSRV